MFERLDSEPNRKTNSKSPATWSMTAVLVLFPVVAFLYSIALLTKAPRTEEGNARYEYWISPNSVAYDSRGAQCDVLIFGDSSAMTGLDPRRIEAKTGLKTCNIAVTFGVMAVLGQDPLKVFLERNGRPKYLVLQYSTAVLKKKTEWDDAAYMEGIDLLLRYYPVTTALKGIAQHPDSLIGVYNLAMRRTVDLALGALKHPAAVQAATLQTTHPISTFRLFTRPAYTKCTPLLVDKTAKVMPDPEKIDQLRTSVAGMADHVLFRITPTCECDPYYPEKKRILDGMGVSMKLYPLQEFNEHFEHFTPDGSKHLSEELAAEIAQKEQGKTP